MDSTLFLQKYCPLYFTDYDNYSHEISTIEQLLLVKDINILLWGTHSCGKTTILNSIIREYYRSIDSSVYEHNILRINNISEQGIKYYRSSVKQFCQIRSTILHRKKIIVMDDIDFINDQCQHVLRSLMDTYSKNVLFIASTNYIENVINNVQTRFTVVKLPVISSTICQHVIQKIKSNEHIEMDEASEQLILEIANNDIRKLIQYLQKFKLMNIFIDYSTALKLCCDINFSIFDEYIQFVCQQDINQSIAIMYQLYDTGYSIIDIFDGFTIYIKQSLQFNEIQKYEIIKLIATTITIFYTLHEDAIELAFFTNKLIQLFLQK